MNNDNSFEDNFSAPSTMNIADVIIDEYNRHKEEIKEVEKINTSCLSFFHNDRISSWQLQDLLSNSQQALDNLNTYMWQKAINLTDVIDFMPSKLKDFWNNILIGCGKPMSREDQISYGFIKENEETIKDFSKLPEISYESLKATLSSLLSKRYFYFTRMVDDIFSNLSTEHITNQPEGFSKRFIINNVYNYDKIFDSIHFGNYTTKVGFINDLRFVINKILGRDKYSDRNDIDTQKTIEKIISTKGYGQWQWIDGFAMQIKCFKKGTVHIEVNPDISWQLNKILSSLYPMAIPESSKRKPKKDSSNKTFELIKDVIPSFICNKLKNCSFRNKEDRNEVNIYTTNENQKHIVNKIDEYMTLIGGTNKPSYSGNLSYVFDYDPRPIINEMIITGVVPEYKSHQYYPTPENIVLDMVKIASDSLMKAKTVLEPSAGTGNIIKGLLSVIDDNIKVNAIEVNPLFSNIIKEKFNKRVNVVNTDFLNYNDRNDIVLMNPPFDQGRWKLHVKHALTLSNHVFAILPSGANLSSIDVKEIIEHNAYNNEFANCSVNVKIIEFKN